MMSSGFEATVADSASATMFSRSSSDPLMFKSSQSGKGLTTVLGTLRLWRTLGVPRHPPGHRSSLASRIFRIQASVPEDGPACTFSALKSAHFSLQSPCRDRTEN
jgi:hypothetical protein